MKSNRNAAPRRIEQRLGLLIDWRKIQCLMVLTVSIAAPALAINTKPSDAVQSAPQDIIQRHHGMVGDFGPVSTPPPFSLQAQDDGFSTAIPLGGGLNMHIGSHSRSNPLDLEDPLHATIPELLFDPRKEDSSPDMQIAWDEWHKRVGAAVFSRFQMMASTAFPRSRPMSAVAAYTITRNGQIMNVRLTEKNFNPIYNAIVLTAIQQLNGDIQTLHFPPGSRRMTMDKVGTFNHNARNSLSGLHDETPYPETIRKWSDVNPDRETPRR